MEKINYSLEGNIFDIQKFSINDGPGIRTVVFFKGCPLACKWCSNPESQSLKSQVLWDKNKCISCFHCVSICPKKAISINNAHIDILHNLCDACEKCVTECPNKALEIKGKKMSVQEVIDTVLQDEVFYEEGNGGMTLSGGEFFLQAAFAKNLLLAAKEKGINTCSETSAQVNQKTFQELAILFDEMIIDVKHYDSNKHFEKTKTDNTLPEANLKWAIKNGIDVLPRIPVIPGFNESLVDANNFIPYLHEIGVTKIQLLPFHQFGENKYKLLGYDYEYENVKNMHKEDLEEYVKILRNGGIDAFL